MNARAAIAAGLVAAAGLGGVAATQGRIDAVRDAAEMDELLYLPNEKLMTNFTGGLNPMLADILWLQCIQYTAKHFQGDGKFEWLAHMGDMITRLDPYFIDAYRFVGIFLAALKADDDASIELMRKGIVNNPDRWELPYEIAMVYLLNRREEPESAALAARYLNMAAITGTAPPSVHAIAQGLMLKHELTDIERDMWTQTLQNDPDPLMRDLAQRKLTLIDVRGTAARLQEMVDAYREQTGNRPSSIEEVLSAGGIGEVSLTDPLGGRFLLIEDEVKNTSLMDEIVTMRMNRLQSMVNAHRRERGALPASLDEMVRTNYMPAVPEHPYPGGRWTYDPATGDVESVLPE